MTIIIIALKVEVKVN